MKKYKILGVMVLLGIVINAPFASAAINPVSWDRFVTGNGGGIRSLYNTNNDHVLIGGAATTTSAQLEVKGNVAITGTTTKTSIGNLQGVLDPTYYPGTDIGAQNNSTYLNAPSTGAAIQIPAATTGSSWSFTTPIVAGTNAKPMRIVCSIGGGSANYATNGTVLLYTPSTGDAITLNTGEGPNLSSSATGIVNCVLQGSGGTTARTSRGVAFGGGNGAFSGSLNGVEISGFGTGVSFVSNTSFNYIQNSAINFNGRNINEPDTGGANCENLRILGSVIADANWQSGGGHPTDYQGMYVQESGNCQWNNVANSFDDNQVFQDQFGGTANVWSWIANHFEDPNGHYYPYIQNAANNTNVINNLIGGDMMTDSSAAPDQMEPTGVVNLIGFTSDVNNNVPISPTRIVNALASSTAIGWYGLTCKGANGAPSTSFVYGNVPCSPFGVGSDLGQPTAYFASSTSAGIGVADFGTSTTNFSVPTPAMVNIGLNPKSTASSTINMKKIQFQGENSAGVVSCVYLVGTTLTAQSGACNN